MTRTAQKKTEVKARHDFIDEAVRITLSALISVIPGIGEKTE